MLHLPPVPWRHSRISVRLASLYNTMAELISEKHTTLFLLICFTSLPLSLFYSLRWNGVWLLLLRAIFADWTLFSHSPPPVSLGVLGCSSEWLLCKCHFLMCQASGHLLCTRDVFKGVSDMKGVYLIQWNVLLEDSKKIMFFMLFLFFPYSTSAT